jgi:hypothetical protein
MHAIKSKLVCKRPAPAPLDWLVVMSCLLLGDSYMYIWVKRGIKRMRSRTTVDLGYRVIYDRR